MGTLSETLRLIIDGNSSGAVKALDEVSGKAAATSAATSSSMAGLNKAANVAAVGFVALGAVIGKSVADYAEFAVTVAKVSAQTDMGAAATSQFLGQLDMLHVNTASAGMVMKTMEKAIYGLETGTKSATTAFKIIQLTWGDIKDLKPEDQIALIRERLSQVVDPAARAAAAQTLLGKGAKEMALWYTASEDSMGKINQTLKANGQILTESQIKQAEQAAIAWKAFGGAMKGVEYTIAQTALPVLTRLLQVMTLIMRTLRPIAPVIVPLTIALGGFVAVVKTAIFFQKTWNQALSLLPGRLIKGKVAEEGLEGATVAENGALKGGIVQMGLYGAAIAGIMVDIYLLVKAYQAWQSAEAAIQQEMQQAKGEAGTANAAQSKINAWQAAHPGQELPASYQQLQNVATQAANEAAGNVGRNILKNLPLNLLTGKGLKLAGGGEFVTKGITSLTVGEAGAERVTVTPLTRGRGGAQGGVHFHNCTFSAHSPRELSQQVSREVMRGVRRQMVGQNA